MEEEPGAPQCHLPEPRLSSGSAQVLLVVPVLRLCVDHPLPTQGVAHTHLLGVLLSLRSGFDCLLCGWFWKILLCHCTTLTVYSCAVLTLGFGGQLLGQLRFSSAPFLLAHYQGRPAVTCFSLCAHSLRVWTTPRERERERHPASGGEGGHVVPFPVLIDLEKPELLDHCVQ